MKSLKKMVNNCLIVFAALFTLNANALDQMAKEEVTPPARRKRSDDRTAFTFIQYG